MNVGLEWAVTRLQHASTTAGRVKHLRHFRSRIASADDEGFDACADAAIMLGVRTPSA